MYSYVLQLSMPVINYLTNMTVSTVLQIAYSLNPSSSTELLSYFRRCVPMNCALLDAWSAVEYQFICRACAFHDDIYAAQAALTRCVIQIHNMCHI